MSGVGEREKVCQKNVVQLFTEQLGYTYLGNLKDRQNSNIEKELLRKFLVKKGYSSELINLAIAELVKVSGNQTKSLFEVNKEVYSLLRYGVQKKVASGEKHKTVSFIDFEDFSENDFYVAEEVTVKGNNTKRPDVVLYVNGIALCILELKRSTVSISEGIRQNLDNQKDTFIKNFFNTIQLVLAGNDTQGAKYGVIGTTEKYYLTWKEDKEYLKKITEDEVDKKISELCKNIDNVLHKHLIGLCYKERFLEIIHDFIVYDRGTKKTCRPNQYFGVKSAHVNVKKREGGIIWHTQGSGKSLTMVWLTKWIMENRSDARILVITDRDELDEQIEKVYKGVDEVIYRTKSGRDLLEKLNTSNPRLLCSLIHKFGKKEDAAYDDFLEELKLNLPKDFSAKGDIYVLVDECHRTQSGKLHEAMETILANALFIGFTGTPLLKKDKQKSTEIFGEYIHKYRFNEAVKDKVVLDLRYEARDVEQNITSQKKIDQWFESKTRGLTDVALAQLKKRWGNLQSVFSSKARLEKIAADIILDMETKDRLKNGRGNAMLVAGSIYEACKYYQIFTEQGFTKCAIVTSYTPNISDIKGESLGEGEGATEKLRKYEIYNKMLNGKKPEEFEKDVKELFINHPAQMKLLIVVDKLLTGFDAPPASYLYIDKSMRDHGLFQAICRVNRLDGDDKEFGYIIDYKDLFNSLENAMKDYTTNALGNYDKSDIEGLLKDRLSQAKEKLDDSLETVEALCEAVEYPRETQQFLHYFCAKNTENKEELKDNEPKRVALYKSVASLMRAYANLANEMLKAGYTKDQANVIKTQVTYYEKVRSEVKLASGDYIDLKTYEPAMRHLIDTYIDAKESEVLSAFDEISLVDLMVTKGSDFVDDLPNDMKKNKETVAETIENNVRRLIIDESPTNPKYFEKMSLLLDEIIRNRKDEVLGYKNYLEKMAELAKKAKHPEESSQYTERTNKTAGLRALFDNIGDEDLAVAVHEEVASYAKDSWRGNKIKERLVRKLIKKYIPDQELVEKVFEIVVKQKEY
jgi:type I site-specific deoxyribonuclease, HsdR family